MLGELEKVINNDICRKIVSFKNLIKLSFFFFLLKG